MADRHGVLMVMYDIPSSTSEGRRESTQFRKSLTRQGFIPLQESIYVKLLRNSITMPSELKRLRESVPPHGSVHALYLSLADFRGMMTLQGEGFSMKRFADDIVIL